MADSKSYNSLSDELLAAYLDGNTSAIETMQILDVARCDDRLREFLEISSMIDESIGMEDDYSIVSSHSMAALNTDRNLCALQCEAFLLRQRGMNVSLKDLISTAKQHGWLCADGTPLQHIGQLLKQYGCVVLNKVHATVNDVCDALNKGYGLIAVVDGGELQGDALAEQFEDKMIGEIPDHAVVILDYDTVSKAFKVFDPQIQNSSVTSYGQDLFCNAWADSQYHLIIVS